MGRSAQSVKKSVKGTNRDPEHPDYIGSQRPPGRRFKPGTVALREIKWQQRHAHESYAIPKANMYRLIREVCQEHLGGVEKMFPNLTTIPGEVRWQSSALEALQEASEKYLVDMFADVQLLAVHAHRVGISHKDINLLMDLRNQPVKSQTAGLKTYDDDRTEKQQESLDKWKTARDKQVGEFKEKREAKQLARDQVKQAAAKQAADQQPPAPPPQSPKPADPKKRKQTGGQGGPSSKKSKTGEKETGKGKGKGKEKEKDNEAEKEKEKQRLIEEKAKHQKIRDATKKTRKNKSPSPPATTPTKRVLRKKNVISEENEDESDTGGSNINNDTNNNNNNNSNNNNNNNNNSNNNNNTANNNNKNSNKNINKDNNANNNNNDSNNNNNNNNQNNDNNTYFSNDHDNPHHDDSDYDSFIAPQLTEVDYSREEWAPPDGAPNSPISNVPYKQIIEQNYVQLPQNVTPHQQTEKQEIKLLKELAQEAAAFFENRGPHHATFEEFFQSGKQDPPSHCIIPHSYFSYIVLQHGVFTSNVFTWVRRILRRCVWRNNVVVHSAICMEARKLAEAKFYGQSWRVEQEEFMMKILSNYNTDCSDEEYIRFGTSYMAARRHWECRYNLLRYRSLDFICNTNLFDGGVPSVPTTHDLPLPVDPSHSEGEKEPRFDIFRLNIKNPATFNLARLGVPFPATPVRNTKSLLEKFPVSEAEQGIFEAIFDAERYKCPEKPTNPRYLEWKKTYDIDKRHLLGTMRNVRSRVQFEQDFCSGDWQITGHYINWLFNEEMPLPYSVRKCFFADAYMYGEITSGAAPAYEFDLENPIPEKSNIELSANTLPYAEARQIKLGMQKASKALERRIAQQAEQQEKERQEQAQQPQVQTEESLVNSLGLGNSINTPNIPSPTQNNANSTVEAAAEPTNTTSESVNTSVTNASEQTDTPNPAVPQQPDTNTAAPNALTTNQSEQTPIPAVTQHNATPNQVAVHPLEQEYTSPTQVVEHNPTPSISPTEVVIHPITQTTPTSPTQVVLHTTPHTPPPNNPPNKQKTPSPTKSNNKTPSPTKSNEKNPSPTNPKTKKTTPPNAATQRHSSRKVNTILRFSPQQNK